MAKRTIELDTPFRKNERVLTTRDLGVVEAGAEGKVQVRNGLGAWQRYWVVFDGDVQVGQVSHHDLVRPDMASAWKQREEDRAAAALAAESQAAAEVAAPADGAGSGGGGIADQIPAALLERSRAAKARLLG